MSAASRARRRQRRRSIAGCARWFEDTRGIFSSPAQTWRLAADRDPLEDFRAAIERLAWSDARWGITATNYGIGDLVKRAAPQCDVTISSHEGRVTVNVYANAERAPAPVEVVHAVHEALRDDLPAYLTFDVRTSRCTICDDCRETPEIGEACYASGYGRKLREEADLGRAPNRGQPIGYALNSAPAFGPVEISTSPPGHNTGTAPKTTLKPR